MSTIETIGTGGDFATPQAWYDAHMGDITSDTNAPYIGELMPETFTGGLDMSGSTTDNTHYFHLRAAAGVEFRGAFSGGYPVITNALPATKILTIGDNYTRLEHFVVGHCSSLPYGIFGTGVTGTLIDGCGVYYMVSGISSITGGINIEGLTAGQTVVIRNCAVGNLHVIGAGAFGVTGIRVASAVNAGVLDLFNNTVNQLISEATTSSATGITVSSIATARIINNAIGILDATTATPIVAAAGALSRLNNAGETSTGLGTSSVYGWASADIFENSTATSAMDLRLRAGQPGNVGAAGANPLRQSGLNLKKASLYINAPNYDIEDQVRGSNIPWNIGADGDEEGSGKGTATAGMLCKKSNGTYTYAQWRLFYAQCPKVNVMCNSNSNAYVSASTVCSQNLW